MPDFTEEEEFTIPAEFSSTGKPQTVTKPVAKSLWTINAEVGQVHVDDPTQNRPGTFLAVLLGKRANGLLDSEQRFVPEKRYALTDVADHLVADFEALKPEELSQEDAVNLFLAHQATTMREMMMTSLTDPKAVPARLVKQAFGIDIGGKTFQEVLVLMQSVGDKIKAGELAHRAPAAPE